MSRYVTPHLLSSGGPLFPQIPLPCVLLLLVSFSSQLITDPSILFDVCGFRFSSFLHLLDNCFIYPLFSCCYSILPIKLFRLSNRSFWTFTQLSPTLHVNPSTWLNFCSITSFGFLNYILFYFSQLILLLLTFFPLLLQEYFGMNLCRHLGVSSLFLKH